MKATDILERVGIALFDIEHVRWTRKEVVNYLNDGQSQVVIFRPDANAVTAVIKLEPGTQQTIPATGIRFMRATRNMGVDGMTPGRAVRECSRVILDNEFPDWHSNGASAVVQNFVFDNIAPKSFSVFPAAPNPSIDYIELVYAGLPTKVLTDNDGNPTSATDELTLPDQYINAFVDFVLARCYAKDASYAGNMSRAGMHLQAFANSIQVSMNSEFMAANPQFATPTPAATPTRRTGS